MIVAVFTFAESRIRIQRDFHLIIRKCRTIIIKFSIVQKSDMASARTRDGDFKVPSFGPPVRQTQINAHFVTNQRQKISQDFKAQLGKELQEINSKKALLNEQSRYDF